MNNLEFYLKRLLGRPTLSTFRLLGQDIKLSPVAGRELRRAHDIDIESELIDHLRLVVRPDDTVYDVGANIGLIAILTASYESSRGCQVLCFEPEPRNFSQLKNHIMLNELDDRVSAYELALGSEAGTAELHIRGSAGEGRHSIATSKGATAAITIRIDTMSAFAAEHDAWPTVVKIDVEGAEGQVISGMESLIEQRPPREIFMEIHPKGERDAMPDGGLIHDWLEQRNYQMVWSNKRRSGEHRHYQLVA